MASSNLSKSTGRAIEEAAMRLEENLIALRAIAAKREEISDGNELTRCMFVFSEAMLKDVKTLYAIADGKAVALEGA